VAIDHADIVGDGDLGLRGGFGRRECVVWSSNAQPGTEMKPARERRSERDTIRSNPISGG